MEAGTGWLAGWLGPIRAELNVTYSAHTKSDKQVCAELLDELGEECEKSDAWRCYGMGTGTSGMYSLMGRNLECFERWVAHREREGGEREREQKSVYDRQQIAWADKFSKQLDRKPNDAGRVLTVQ